MNYGDIIGRLRKLFCLGSDKEIAGLLGVTPLALRVAKNRNAIHYGRLLDVCVLHDKDLNYVFYGEEREVEGSTRKEKIYIDQLLTILRDDKDSSDGRHAKKAIIGLLQLRS